VCEVHSIHIKSWHSTAVGLYMYTTMSRSTRISEIPCTRSKFDPALWLNVNSMRKCVTMHSLGLYQPWSYVWACLSLRFNNTCCMCYINMLNVTLALLFNVPDFSLSVFLLNHSPYTCHLLFLQEKTKTKNNNRIVVIFHGHFTMLNLTCCLISRPTDVHCNHKSAN